MRTLITTPQLELMGGVANYYKEIRKYFNCNYEYFTGCKRKDERINMTCKRVVIDYYKFMKKIRAYDLVVLNPSFDVKSLIRDAVFLVIAKKNKKKVVVFFRGWNRKVENRIKKKWMWLFRWIYFKSDAFIILSREFMNSLVQMGYNGKIYKETTIVPDEAICFYQENRENKKKDGFTILVLSRLEKTKGIYEAIETYKILKNCNDKIKMVVAGDGNELKNLKRIVDDKKYMDINFVGYVNGEKKYKTFMDADCYLFPSYHSEGMPNSALEAMAFGLPIVTRDVAGLVDFFENGKMGFMTNSKKPEYIARLIEKLIENVEMRAEISIYNHEYAKKNFMASVVAKRLEQKFDNIFWGCNG